MYKQYVLTLAAILAIPDDLLYELKDFVLYELMRSTCLAWVLQDDKAAEVKRLNKRSMLVYLDDKDLAIVGYACTLVACECLRTEGGGGGGGGPQCKLLVRKSVCVKNAVWSLAYPSDDPLTPQEVSCKTAMLLDMVCGRTPLDFFWEEFNGLLAEVEEEGNRRL